MDAEARREEREGGNAMPEDSEQNGAWLLQEPKDGYGLKRATHRRWE